MYQKPLINLFCIYREIDHYLGRRKHQIKVYWNLFDFSQHVANSLDRPICVPFGFAGGTWYVVGLVTFPWGCVCCGGWTVQENAAVSPSQMYPNTQVQVYLCASTFLHRNPQELRQSYRVHQVWTCENVWLRRAIFTQPRISLKHPQEVFWPALLSL